MYSVANRKTKIKFDKVYAKNLIINIVVVINIASIICGVRSYTYHFLNILENLR